MGSILSLVHWHWNCKGSAPQGCLIPGKGRFGESLSRPSASVGRATVMKGREKSPAPAGSSSNKGPMDYLIFSADKPIHRQTVHFLPSKRPGYRDGVWVKLNPSTGAIPSRRLLFVEKLSFARGFIKNNIKLHRPIISIPGELRDGAIVRPQSRFY